MNRSRTAFAFAAATLAVAAFATFSPVRAADDSSLLGELKVRMALLDKLGVDALRIDVRVVDTTAILAGTVQKRATVELADGVARSVSGISSVDNEIRLAEYQKDASRSDVAATETQREFDDLGLKTKIRFALIDKMGSDGFRIGTDVASGVVSLEFPKGFDPQRKAYASSIASKVSGVSKVIEIDKK
jgi:osmotically-inducible protein OsmY